MFVGEDGAERTAAEEQREGEEHELFGERETDKSLAVDGAQEYAEENDNEKDLRRDIDYFATKAQGALEVANLAEDKD